MSQHTTYNTRCRIPMLPHVRRWTSTVQEGVGSLAATFAHRISLTMKKLRRLTEKRRLDIASIRVFFLANETPA
jgi:hypothetical protein